MAPKNRKIEYVPLSDIVLDERNPKSHDLDVMDSSVSKYGFIESVVRDDRTGKLVAGHGRVKTLRAKFDAGEDAPEGIKVSKDGAWLVPVSTGWSSRSDTEAAGALIVLNRATELGGWVDDALLNLLDVLSDEDSLEGTGFTDEDVVILQEKVEALGQSEFFADEAGDTTSTFNSSDGWEDPSEDVVEFKLPMTTDERKVVTAHLREVKETKGLETLTDALLAALGLEVAEVEVA